MACQTMNRSSYKEVGPFITCSDSTFQEFEEFVEKWRKGLVPDFHGETGLKKNDKGRPLPRPFKDLTANVFRPLNGLKDIELRQVWRGLALGSLWMKKPASLKHATT